MGVLVGTQVLYIERIKKAQLVEANIQVGSTLPTYCTSMGKVLLAWLDTAAAAEHMPPELERLGPKTIVDHDMLDRRTRAGPRTWLGSPRPGDGAELAERCGSYTQ